MRVSGISIGYCNIRGICGSRYSLEKSTEAFDILLFQETKLHDGTTFPLSGTTFPLSDVVFPPEGVCNGLAYAYRRNSICTVTFLNFTTFTTDDKQLQLLQIHDLRLHKPLTLVNLYVRSGSAADSCQWDFLRDLSDTYENLKEWRHMDPKCQRSISLGGSR